MVSEHWPFCSFSVNFSICQSIQEFKLASCHSNYSLLFSSPDSDLLEGGNCVLCHVPSAAWPTPGICVLLSEDLLVWKELLFLQH